MITKQQLAEYEFIARRVEDASIVQFCQATSTGYAVAIAFGEKLSWHHAVDKSLNWAEDFKELAAAVLVLIEEVRNA